jgi:hypothetical protein
MAGVSADPGRLVVHQAGIDAYTHKELIDNATWANRAWGKNAA